MAKDENRPSPPISNPNWGTAKTSAGWGVKGCVLQNYSRNNAARLWHYLSCRQFRIGGSADRQHFAPLNMRARFQTVFGPGPISFNWCLSLSSRRRLEPVPKPGFFRFGCPVAVGRTLAAKLLPI